MLVALDDKVFEATFDEFEEAFPDLEFVYVGADLSKGDYMYSIEKATKGLDIQLVFNNVRARDPAAAARRHGPTATLRSGVADPRRPPPAQAGFITPGLFHRIPLARNLGNYECNATCTIGITHLFINRMTAAGKKGCVFFTSSSAGLVPNPLSAMYASTKAFLTMFASSVAAEVRSLGIDVVVVHPSPVASNFFDKGSSLS